MAAVLWDEIKSVEDPAIRRGLLKRIAGRLVERYQNDVAGESLGERMTSLAALMGERDIPFVVDKSGALPILSALACPYPELAKADRERMHDGKADAFGSAWARTCGCRSAGWMVRRAAPSHRVRHKR